MSHAGRRRLAFVALIALLGALPGTARALELTIAAPLPGEAVFGAVEVRVAVSPAGAASEVRRVEFYLDGRRVGSASTAPFRTVVDAGQENREHHIEAVAFGAAGPLASAELRTPALRVDEQIDVNLQQLFVTVERGGEPVPGLTREDFEVWEDGVRQPVTGFEGGEVPFTAVILLDASTSMQGGQIKKALDGARAFFASMASFDEAKLLLFSDRLLLETPFTSITAILTLGLSGVEATGGTALNDSLYVALKRLEPREGRKVVVLLSDGVDVDSVLGMDDLKAALGGAPAALLYWLRLRRDEEAIGRGQVRISTAWRDPDGHRHEIDQLHRMVLASGGRIATIDRVDQVKDALSGILRELRGQYVLSYYPSRGHGGGASSAPPKVDVRLRPRGMDVRVHRGEHGK
ncbi:MAG TPA: VWA domain-containing protein [Thermoanaerobaculia bacterium]|nr:VWA domain-containing protein [Thermoanaerobaculia bacterium]